MQPKPTPPSESLPELWIERIWQRMRSAYGDQFDRKWECPAGADPIEHVRDLKAEWGRKLGVYRSAWHAIGWALDNLPPDYPPNLLQFRDLCNSRPARPLKALPLAPIKPDPGRVRDLLASRANVRKRSGAEMASDLLARAAKGEKLTMAQREFIHSNLGRSHE